MQISVKQLSPNAKLPFRAHEGDAGADLFYCPEEASEPVTLKPGERFLFSTGIAVAVPNGYVGLIWDKSGVAVKTGLTVLGGVIDAGYRGEVKVCLLNTGSEDITIEPGQKIAQILIQPVVGSFFSEVDELPEATDNRGDGGFGSTGLV